MADYDFKSLNDKEFEILCCDILSEAEGARFERFKPGRDAGVDGRYFADQDKEVILQCKHWTNTPVTKLIHALKTIEKAKLDALNPYRYILAVSNVLSRADKNSIVLALAPHIKTADDIYGKEDLNDLLARSLNIERRHYKLWLHSSNIVSFILNNDILGRSAFSRDEIYRSLSLYAVTSNHKSALTLLDRLGVVIISGDPGVGKTTLANHLCVHYLAQGFEYIKIGEDIREAEAVFVSDTKQIFYFDDFLGRNYLEAVKGNEGDRITQFIRRVVANKNKRFVLTSRSTILSQGKFLSDSFEHGNLARNEFELRIESLTELDRGQILYNHIWHSSLEKSFVDQIYSQKRYRRIISHRNFNPRLVSYITDSVRLESLDSGAYWNYIQSSMANPSHIWENPFDVQQDDFGRIIILLVVLHGKSISESALSTAYHRYLALPESQNLHGRRDFRSNIRLLTGSLLNRYVQKDGSANIDVFNPSIGDYVLRRYAGDTFTLRNGMLCLLTSSSVATLYSLSSNKMVNEKECATICDAILEKIAASSFCGVSIEFVSAVAILRIIRSEHYHIDANRVAAAQHIISNGAGEAVHDSYLVSDWAFGEGVISADQLLDFIDGNIANMESEDDIMTVSSLLARMPADNAKTKIVVEHLGRHVVETIRDNNSDFIEVSDAFSEVVWGDYDGASEKVGELLREKFKSLGVEIDDQDIVDIIDNIDLTNKLDDYWVNSDTGGESYSQGPDAPEFDEIDDLFAREE
jgi:adenylate kinase family enzyme